VHIEEVTSEVTAIAGDLPLSEPQIEELVRRVLERLEEKKRESEQIREATVLRREARPPLRIAE
jgi:hypothetical protein